MIVARNLTRACRGRASERPLFVVASALKRTYGEELKKLSREARDRIEQSSRCSGHSATEAGRV